MRGLSTGTSALAALAVLLLCGCGTRQALPSRGAAVSSPSAGSGVHGHPQAVEPVAGAAGPGGAAAPGGAGTAAIAANATTGGVAGVSVGPPPKGLPEPVSDAVIRRELAASGVSARSGRATLTPSGLAVAPANAPPVVQAMIAAGNQIAHLPYVWGGGHATFVDTGYDCSGSLSYVFASAGILSTTVTSGQLMNMGLPGPGRWVTIYANNGHTFMIVAGLRFDTVALAQTGSRWSTTPPNEPDLSTFAIRHPPGL